MKLAFSTLPVQALDADKLADLADRHDMAVEPRAASDGTFPVSARLCVTDVGSGICLRGFDEAQISDARAFLERVRDAGLPAVRVFLGNFRMKWEMPARPLDEEGCVRAVRALCEVGPAIWIETHNEYATAASLVPFLKKVDRPNVGVIWDVIHPIEDGETPAETWGQLKPWIRHLHIKDGIPHPDPDYHDWYYTRLGEGRLPVGEIVRMLLSDGYDGYFSLEWESAWRPELAGLCDDPDALLADYARYMDRLVTDKR
ncbi:MAG: sugar phosphate isomerase/epimerase [Clostridia bacterium]|nr:sugar phosphate isomerase/epimerase [Clostridia bacterium]